MLLENTTDHVSTKVLEFKSHIRGYILAKPQPVETSLQLLKATATPYSPDRTNPRYE
jgi:hypothetical protein